MIHAVGKTYHYLTVVEELDRKVYDNGRSRTIRRRILCRCACGSFREYDLIPVHNGRIKSCGCMRSYLATGRNSPTHKHGLSHGRIWNVWKDMHRRCKDPKRKGYENYGGRGIAVDPRWDDIAAFYEDMGDPPSAKHTIDRIDNDGPYSPENCRWATRRVQAQNSRRAKLLTHRGRTQPLVEWSRELGIPYNRIQSRLARGWDVERALTTP